MGIEPTSSAWKAEVLPLNYARERSVLWWRGEDSNLRRLNRQIYSLIPLTTREPLLKASSALWGRLFGKSTDFAVNFTKIP